MSARGEFFRSYHLPVLFAEQIDSQSEEINVIDESPAENKPLPVVDHVVLNPRYGFPTY